MSYSIDLRLHPRQSDVYESKANEILYGGAAGGGKSHLMRVLAIVLCCEIPGFQAYLFRRESNDLDKNHMEGPKGFRSLLAPLIMAGRCKIVQGEIRFYNSAKIWLCHCKDEDDIYKYQGAEMHALFIDEATYFTEKMVRFLRSRLRVPGLNIPAHWRERLPLMVLSANPIGVGVEWVKRWFIDLQPPMAIMSMPNSEGGMRRQFVPALLEDNPSMAEDDPQYEAKLEGLGSAALVAAMRRGDWTAIEGAFFPGFGRTVIRPFTIPLHWLRFVSFDWGGARPFSVGWWAVSNGVGVLRDEPCPYRPGELIRYREWYGASAPNVGLQLSNVAIRDGILQRQGREDISYYVADPSIFTRRGAPSIAEDMGHKADQPGINWRPGHNDRVNGWRQMRDRIEGFDGRPMVWCFDTCRDSIRTIPFLIHDEHNPEDLNCFVAGTQIATIDGARSIEAISEGDFVWTPLGFRRVLRAGMSGWAQIWTARLSNGATLSGTGNHKVFLPNSGLVELSKLKCGDILQARNIAIWPIRQSNIAESFILGGLAADIMNLMGHIYLKVLHRYTGKFGWTRMVRSRQDLTSIIQTATPIITTYQTWNVSSDDYTRSGTISKDKVTSSANLSSGEEVSEERKLFGQTLEKCASERPSGNLRAQIVERLCKRATKRKNIAVKLASLARMFLPCSLIARFAVSPLLRNAIRLSKRRPVHILAVGSSGVIAPVYNLTVEQAHLYYANGVLVTNTDGEDHAGDEWRYGLNSRPWTRPAPPVREPERGGVKITLRDLIRAENN